MSEKKTEIPTLYIALAQLGKKIKNPKRSKEVEVKYKNSDKKYKFKYAPLDKIFEEIRPILAELDLSFYQTVDREDGNNWMSTVITHKCGESIKSKIPIPGKTPEKLQDYGAMLSYLKRYGFCAALGIASEDDNDGSYQKSKYSKAKVREHLGKYNMAIGRAQSTEELKNLSSEYAEYKKEANDHYPELIYNDPNDGGMSIKDYFSKRWTELLDQEKEVERMESEYKNKMAEGDEK